MLFQGIFGAKEVEKSVLMELRVIVVCWRGAAVI